MEPGLIHIVRWALYVDVGFMFGMPAVALAVGADVEFKRWRGFLVGAGLICAPLSIFGFLINVAQMADVRLDALESSLILTLLTGSALGLSLILRCIAALAYALFSTRKWSSSALIAGGIAAASLAWLGHGGSSEGVLGYVRLVGDMLHLLAASAWIGGLALLLLMLLKVRQTDTDQVAHLGRVLSAFALPGSLIVGTLILTGLSNMLFIALPPTWPQIAHGSYGMAMIAKLALFLGMLALATVNRFVLVPLLMGRDGASAIKTARATIAVEAAAGFAILLLVAWLGTLDPMAI
jgi:putative copper resistance protein D